MIRVDILIAKRNLIAQEQQLEALQLKCGHMETVCYVPGRLGAVARPPFTVCLDCGFMKEES